MSRFTGLALLATLSLVPAFAPVAASAAEQASTRCTPAQLAGAKLSNSGLNCTQWVSSFQAPATETARNERAPAPRS